MPIYEYTCAACGHDMEAIQKMSDPLLVDCPACGKPELKKQISAAGFRLKGSGWYETDFKHSGKPKKDTEKTSVEGSRADGQSAAGADKAATPSENTKPKASVAE